MLDLLALVVRSPFVIAARVTGARPSHRHGVAGRGGLVVRDALAFPTVAFFRPGARLDVVLRHANLDFDDDARLDIRGAALRLTSADGEQLDLPMNTGTVNTFQTLWVLLAFVAAKPYGSLGNRALALRYPRIWRETVEAYRRGPSSYAQLRYHSQIPFRWAADDGVERIARLRLVPANDDPESGLPTMVDHTHPFRQERAADDPRASDYLRREWAARVASTGAAYRLQVQVHAVDPGDPAEVLDTSRGWDEGTHPWHELGEVRVDSVLDAAASDALRFNIAHQPRSMGVLRARSAGDFNAPAYARTLAYAASQRARTRTKDSPR